MELSPAQVYREYPHQVPVQGFCIGTKNNTISYENAVPKKRVGSKPARREKCQGFRYRVHASLARRIAGTA